MFEHACPAGKRRVGRLNPDEKTVRRRLTALFRVLIAALFSAVIAFSAADASEPPVERTPPRETEPLLDDFPEPLVPRRERTEEEEDRLHALAHFSAGRALAQREQYARAIGHYQRALRYDPSASNVGWTVVALAEKLEWNDVRDRYLLLTARLEPDSLEPPDLLRLVDLVEDENDVRLVTRLFERLLASRANEKQTPLDVVLRWRLAEIRLATGEYAKAAEQAAQVLEALEHPERIEWDRAQFEEWFGRPHPPYWLFGDYFVLAERWDEAEATFRKAHESQPNAGLLHFSLARIDLKRKRPEAAREHLEEGFREGVAELGTQPYTMLRTVLTELGRGDELIPRLEGLFADDPGRHDLACFLAQQYIEAGRLDEAEKLLGSLGRDLDDPRIDVALVRIHRKKGRIEPLLRVLGRVAGRQASLGGLGGQLDAISSDAVLLDRLFAEARRRFAEKPDALGPHAPLAAALLAFEAGRDDLANPFFEAALLAVPERTFETLLGWGAQLMAERRFAEAADVFRRGTAAGSPVEARTRCYYYLAAALEMDGHTDEALAAVRAARRLNDDSPLLAAHEAWILYHAKRNDEARQAHAEIIERFRDNHSSPAIRQVLREARLVLAHIELQLGERDKAVERLEEVLDEFPNDASAMNDLGYLWADEGVHLKRALRMTRHAVEAEPDNAAYRDSLGWALYRLGRLQEAVVVLEKAVDMLPDGEVLEHLGEVYLKLGETRRAAEAWLGAAEAYRKADRREDAEAVDRRIADENLEGSRSPAMEKDK